MGVGSGERTRVALQTLAAPDFKETRSYGGDARLDSIATTIRAGGLVRSHTRSYAHDTHGRLLTVAHPSGLTVRRQYNARGYLSALRNNADMSSLVAYTGVNARGQATNESYGNGTALTRTFDAESGRLEGALTERGAAEVRHDAYKWRSDGLLESRADEAGAAVRRETFTHDRLGRLTSAAAPLSGGGSRTLSMTYDRLGSLKTRSSSAAGDLDMSVTALGGGSAAPGPTAATTATLGAATHALAYDAGGRVTRDDDQSMGGTDRHFAWNARGLLRKAVVGDSLTDATPEAAEECAYGPDGARHYRKSTWRDGSDPNNVTFPVEHRFYLDGFEERVGGGANAPRVETTRVAGAILHTRTTAIAEDPDDAEGAMTTQTSSISYLHRDHLGSARAVTNASGSAVAAASYDPYGGRRLDDGSRGANAAELAAAAGDRTLDGARGFTGHEQLDRIGLIHMGGRVYDPRLGRFLSPDPVIGAPGRSQSWNLYGYAGNSPMSFTDPTGLAQAPLPWEDDPCGGMLGCGNFDGGGGFGATSQRIASYRYYIYAGVVTFILPVWRGDGGWGPRFRLVSIAFLFGGRTPTSVSASTPGDPEPAGRPISSAGDAAQQSGGSAVPANIAVAFVGGAGDEDTDLVKGIYRKYTARSGVGAYFRHGQGKALRKWIDEQNERGVKPIVIGHSLGASTAARAVYKGHSVHELRTVDGVGRRTRSKRFYRKVAKHSTTWINYDSTSTERTRANTIASWGGRWNDAPEGFADHHIPSELEHMEICRIHCEPSP